MSDRWSVQFLPRIPKENYTGDRPLYHVLAEKMHYVRRIWRLTFPSHTLPPQEAPTFFSHSLPPHRPLGDIFTAGCIRIGFSDFESFSCLVIEAQILYSTKYGRTTRDLLYSPK